MRREIFLQHFYENLKFKHYSSLSISFFLFFLFFCACYPKNSFVTHFKGMAHTHAYHIQIGTFLSQQEKKTITQLIEQIFEEVDTFYNHWNPHSELAFLNRLETGEAMDLSPSLLKLIQKAKEITFLTQGLFDPTLGSFIKMWKDALKKQKLPQKTSKLTSGWHLFPLQEKTITRLSNTSLLDFDGCLKGFIIDKLIHALKDQGYKNCYVEWGGDMRAVGNHPSKRPWQIQLFPFNKVIVTLSNEALATSGNTEQYLEKDGKRYCHIIHPKTKEAIGLKAVSVRAPTCFLADALATALMTFSKAEAVFQFLEKNKQAFKHCTIWAQTQNQSPFLIWQG